MKTEKIYVLTEPDGGIRYVGKTGYNLSIRFSQHLCNARCGEKSYRSNWIRSILAQGLLPKIEFIGESDDGSRDEIAWIKYFREEGVPLVNTTIGGDGVVGLVCSDETRRKIGLGNKGKTISDDVRRRTSLSLRGRKHSKESIEKMRISRCGFKMSNEQKEKLRLVHVGKKLSEEHKLKIGIGNKGKKVSLITRQKMSLARIGWNPSDETRQKIRLSRLGSKLTEETKQKLSAFIMGHPGYTKGMKFSDETKAKMSASQKARWIERKKVA